MIIWTDAERLSVAESFYSLQQNGHILSRAQDNWQQAQRKVLEPKRWRAFATPADATSMNKYYRELLKSGHFYKKAPPPPPVIETPKPDLSKVVVINGQHVSKDTYKLVADHIESNRVPPPPVTLDSLFRKMIDEQIHSSMPRLLHEIDKHLMDQQQHIEGTINNVYMKMMKAFDPNFKDEREVVIVEAATPEPKFSKPTVILVNANKPQVDSVQDSFPQFEIKSVRDRCPQDQHALLVVGFTKFMNKDLRNICKKKFGDGYLELSPTGAASEARQKIGHRLQHVMFDQ
jgi:hypothetical protein